MKRNKIHSRKYFHAHTPGLPHEETFSVSSLKSKPSDMKSLKECGFISRSGKQISNPRSLGAQRICRGEYDLRKVSAAYFCNALTISSTHLTTLSRRDVGRVRIMSAMVSACALSSPSVCQKKCLTGQSNVPLN